MKKVIVIASALALAACGGADTDTDQVVAEEVAVAEVSPVVGTYIGTAEDGSEWSSVLNEDGTYVDTEAGETTETGTWTETDGLTCFLPNVAEGEEAEDPTCYTVGEVAEDGSVVITDTEGEEQTIQKAVS